jgi:hypothetical protein
MKIFKFLPAVFVIVFLLGGCASSDSSDNQVELGDYTFTMYDNAGGKIASGTMTVTNITVKDVNTPQISGTYTVDTWHNPDFPPKDAMEGEFAGNADYKQGKVFINTNPKVADANVFFNVTIYSSFYQGEWNYSTFRGSTSRGELVIRKKK